MTEPAHEFTFMKRVMQAKAKQVVCPECSSARATGVRTHHTTGQHSITPLTIEVRQDLVVVVIAIAEGGVTGWEQVYLDDRFLDLSQQNGWLACMGTAGRHDKLFVPPKEMRSALAKLGLT